MSPDICVSTLDATERIALHRSLQVILRAAHTSNVQMHLRDQTVGAALELYEQFWNRHLAFTGQVVDYAQQLLPRGALGTLQTDLGDRPRKLLDEQPAYLALTLDEWLEALTEVGDEPEPYLPWSLRP